MAFGMKQWGAIALAGMATAAVVMLPAGEGRTRPAVGPETVDAASSYRLSLNRQLEALDLALKRTRRADSLRILVAGTDVPEGEVVVGWPPFGEDEGSRVDARWAADIEDAIRDEVSSEPGADSAPMAVGVFWVPGEAGGHPGVRDNWIGAGPEVYAGDVDGRAYCMVVHPFREGQFRRSLLNRPGYRPQPGGVAWAGGRESSLGPCEYWRRYGEPGARVRAWLEDGALGFALLRRAPDPERLGIAMPRFPFMGPRLKTDPNLLLAGCLAGDDASCGRALFDPEVLAGLGDWRSAYVRPDDRTHMPDAYVGAVTGRFTRHYFMPALLAELENHFGAEAFEAFWTSTGSPDEAFEGAFGVAPEEWFRSWAGPQVGGPWTGPRVGWGALLLMCLTVAGSLAVAGFVAGRRRLA